MVLHSSHELLLELKESRLIEKSIQPAAALAIHVLRARRIYIINSALAHHTHSNTPAISQRRT
jgi:hypothetical protein